MSKTKLIIQKNGSINIEGDFEIMDPKGTVCNLQAIAVLGLCRYGLLAKKPFCDGSHRNNFQYDAIAFDLLQ